MSGHGSCLTQTGRIDCRERAMVDYAIRRQQRRDLLQKYVQLQRELGRGNTASSSYQATIHAFRRMGYALIANGMEEDLDRLLRIRVIEGGKQRQEPRRSRAPRAW